jgi:hypothetical protein
VVAFGPEPVRRRTGGESDAVIEVLAHQGEGRVCEEPRFAGERQVAERVDEIAEGKAGKIVETDDYHHDLRPQGRQFFLQNLGLVGDIITAHAGVDDLKRGSRPGRGQGVFQLGAHQRFLGQAGTHNDRVA